MSETLELAQVVWSSHLTRDSRVEVAELEPTPSLTRVPVPAASCGDLGGRAGVLGELKTNVFTCFDVLWGHCQGWRPHPNNSSQVFNRQ